MKWKLTLVMAMACIGSGVCAAEHFPWKNSGFEAAFENWKGGGRLTQITQEAAHSGKSGLRVNDDNSAAGSELFSQDFAVTPGVTYASRYWARNVAAGEHVLVYHHYFDKDGKLLKPVTGGNEEFLGLSKDSGWKHYTFCTRAPENAAVLRLRVHSIDAQKAVADFDDFELLALSPAEERAITTTRLGRGAFPPLDVKRIRAVSRMLPAEAQGIGAPAQDRAAWQEILKDQGFVRRVIARGEKLLNADIPDAPDELYLEFLKNGNRVNYEKVYFAKRDMLNHLALAECMELQGRFIPKLTEVIESTLAERSWVLPAHDSKLTNFNGTALYADLFCSATAAELAQIDWMLQAQLPAELRARIRSEIMRRALNPYWNVIRKGASPYGTPWMTGDNNWNAVCTRNMVIASQCLLPDPLDRAEFIAAAEVSTGYFVKGFSEDGYCSEGMGYWNYGFGHFMDMNEVILMATKGKLDLLKQFPILDNVCAFAKNILMDDKLNPGFADSSMGAPDNNLLELIQYHRPAALRQRVPRQHPNHSVIPFAIHAFAKPVADVTKAPEKPVLEARSYFRDAGVLICREDVPSSGHFCAAVKGGHNGELHNHNDVGSYVISVAGIPLVLDPGGEVYTRQTFSAKRYESKVLNSYGHDVPMVAGKLQSTGKVHRAEVLTANFTLEQDEFVLDMTRAYEHPELKKLIRRFTFDRKTPAVTVTDEVEFNTPQAFESAIITKSNFRIIDDLHLELEEKGKLLEAEIKAEGGAVKLDSEKIPNPGRIEPTRIRVSFQAPVKQGRITVKYIPRVK